MLKESILPKRGEVRTKPNATKIIYRESLQNFGVAETIKLPTEKRSTIE